VYEWHKQIQVVIQEIDNCIKSKNDEILTLSYLAKKLGYSEFYVSRKFKEISEMNLRDYMRSVLVASSDFCPRKNISFIIGFTIVYLSFFLLIVPSESMLLNTRPCVLSYPPFRSSIPLTIFSENNPLRLQ
jgi:hypothetical protein